MKRLPEFAVNRPTIVVTLVVLLVLAGVFSFLNMPRREDPEFTLKICVVSTRWEGASAEQVEKLITDPLEKTIQGLEEVKLIRSSSLSEQSVIFVELEESVSSAKVDDAWDRIRARVEHVQMPAGAGVPFVNDEFADTSIIVFAVHQIPVEGAREIEPQYAYSQRQLDDYSERIRDALLLLPGVAKVDRHGVQEEAIFLETSAGNWAQLQLTTDYVALLAEAQNIVASGGLIDSPEGRFFVKPDGDVKSVEAINHLAVSMASPSSMSNQVTIGDLGLTVRRGPVDPPTRICRFGDANRSVPANSIAVSMKSGSNIIDICDRSRERIRQLQENGELPPDVAVSVISDQSVSVRGRIQEVLVNVVQAILIVVAVVFLFVGFRTAAVMAANIPFVVLISLAIIPALGVQLEQMSLASMIIALGLLVDNAVQICDQAATNQQAGMKPKEAAVSGAQLLGGSMLNGTLTTIAAFIPMIIAMDGSNREFIYSLPVTLSVMLGISWILAMTFCVILASLFIRPPKDISQPTAPLPWLASKVSRGIRNGLWQRLFKKLVPGRSAGGIAEPGPDEESRIQSPESPDGEPRGALFQSYGGLLGFALRHRVATLAAAFGLLVLTLQLPISTEFFPLTERNQFAVKIFLPESASIEQTDKVARQVEEAIRKVSPYTNEEGEQTERLRNMRTLVGGGGSRWYLSWEPEFAKPNYAEILIHTTDGKLTHEFAESLKQVVQEGSEELGIAPIVGARVVPIELLLGPPADPVVLRVVGDGFADMKKLRDAADRIKNMVDREPHTWDVNDSWGTASQQLFIDVADERIGMTGVRNSEIASSLNSFYSGRLLTYHRMGNRLVPVYFRLREEDRQSIGNLQTAYIESSIGKIPLSAVAEVVPQWRPSKIDRRNGNRTIEVRSQIAAGASGNEITNRVFSSEAMDQLRAELPVGMKVEIGGALEESQSAQWKMLASFGMSLIAVVVLLICQFNSLFRTTIIVATLPLALGGAMLGLWATSNSLGFMPQLGILALFGIVLNAAILFVEFADILVRQAKEKSGGNALSQEQLWSAIVMAGKQRLRPIFLTTATTVGGLVPLALAGGPLWIAMAWLLIFGLTFATLLTLLIIPLLYSFQKLDNG